MTEDDPRLDDIEEPELDWAPDYPPISQVAYVDYDGDTVRVWRDAQTVVITAQAVHIPLSRMDNVLADIAVCVDTPWVEVDFNQRDSLGHIVARTMPAARLRVGADVHLYDLDHLWCRAKVASIDHSQRVATFDVDWESFQDRRPS